MKSYGKIMAELCLYASCFVTSEETRPEARKFMKSFDNKKQSPLARCFTGINMQATQKRQRFMLNLE